MQTYEKYLTEKDMKSPITKLFNTASNFLKDAEYAWGYGNSKESKTIIQNIQKKVLNDLLKAIR